MKFSLICMNIFTFLGGAVALGLGLWVWIDRSFSHPLMSNNLFIASLAVVVVMGAAVMLLSFLGCCGAVMEVKCMLLTYYILLFIIFVLMLVGGILQFVYREQVSSNLVRGMHAAIPYYGVRPEYTKTWDDTHSLMQCCGVKGPEDWNSYLPESCCLEIYPGKRLECQSNPNPTTTYMVGCADKLTIILKESSSYIGAVGVTVAAVMFLALVLSCGLFVKIE